MQCKPPDIFTLFRSKMFAIEPPEYFPGLEYAALLSTVDQFYIEGACQYSRQSFQNRARLRNPDGCQWISIPLIAGQFGHSADETEIDYSQNWVNSHLKSLRYNYASSPFYEHFMDEIAEILNQRHRYLGELTSKTVTLVHRLLGCDSCIQQAREGEHKVGSSDTRMYPVSYEAAIEKQKETEHESEPINRLRLDLGRMRYRQNFEGFQSGMSSLDLLFNHGPDAGRMLRQVILTTD